MNEIVFFILLSHSRTNNILCYCLQYCLTTTKYYIILYNTVFRIVLYNVKDLLEAFLYKKNRNFK